MYGAVPHAATETTSLRQVASAAVDESSNYRVNTGMRRRFLSVTMAGMALIVTLCVGLSSGGAASLSLKSNPNNLISLTDPRARQTDPRVVDQAIDDDAGADDMFDFMNHASEGSDKNDRSTNDTAPDPGLTDSYLEGDMDLYYANSSIDDSAVCLDGSTPAFWLRESGATESANKWIVHLKGGGWCTTKDECANWVKIGFQVLVCVCVYVRE